MLKVVVSKSLNMHSLLSSIILCCFLTFSVNINPVISAANSINSDQLLHDSSPFMQKYKDFFIETSMGSGFVSASLDPKTNVESKDTVYSPEFNLSARLYLPNDAAAQGRKIPLLVYFHGGGFFNNSPFNSTYHNFMNILVSEANVVAVSVDYRLSGVCTLPCAYDDSWTSLKWVASHLSNHGPEDWLNKHADFRRVFLSGDSAGANIAHQMALRLGLKKTLKDFKHFKDFNVSGMILCHPYFWGRNPIPGETADPSDRSFIISGWEIACPGCGVDHPWINPSKDPNLGRMASLRLQVFVSEKDELHLRERGWYYVQKLRENRWSGFQEVIDFQGEKHVFHVRNLTSHNSTILRSRIVTFINQEWN